jgi:hypothetical protein
MECVNDCPKNSLDVYVFGKHIKKQTFILWVIGGFFGALGLFMLTPRRQTKPLSNIVNEQWTIDVANIKGSNTLQYVIDKTKVPFEYFQTELKLPADIDKWIKLKEIGTTYDIKNGSWEIIETEDIRATIVKYMEIQK